MKIYQLVLFTGTMFAIGGCSTADLNAVLTGVNQGLANSGYSNSANSGYSNSAPAIPKLNCTGGETVQWHRGEYYCGFSSPSSTPTTNTSTTQPKNAPIKNTRCAEIEERNVRNSEIRRSGGGTGHGATVEC